MPVVEVVMSMLVVLAAAVGVVLWEELCTAGIRRMPTACVMWHRDIIMICLR
jgi:hypothetical protein